MALDEWWVIRTLLLLPPLLEGRLDEPDDGGLPLDAQEANAPPPVAPIPVNATPVDPPPLPKCELEDVPTIATLTASPCPVPTPATPPTAPPAVPPYAPPAAPPYAPPATPPYAPPAAPPYAPPAAPCWRRPVLRGGVLLGAGRCCCCWGCWEGGGWWSWAVLEDGDPGEEKGPKGNAEAEAAAPERPLDEAPPPMPPLPDADAPPDDPPRAP